MKLCKARGDATQLQGRWKSTVRTSMGLLKNFGIQNLLLEHCQSDEWHTCQRGRQKASQPPTSYLGALEHRSCGEYSDIYIRDEQKIDAYRSDADLREQIQSLVKAGNSESGKAVGCGSCIWSRPGLRATVARTCRRTRVPVWFGRAHKFRSLGIWTHAEPWRISIGWPKGCCVSEHDCAPLNLFQEPQSKGHTCRRSITQPQNTGEAWEAWKSCEIHRNPVFFLKQLQCMALAGSLHLLDVFLLLASTKWLRPDACVLLYHSFKALSRVQNYAKLVRFLRWINVKVKSIGSGCHLVSDPHPPAAI